MVDPARFRRPEYTNSTLGKLAKLDQRTGDAFCQPDSDLKVVPAGACVADFSHEDPFAYNDLNQSSRQHFAMDAKFHAVIGNFNNPNFAGWASGG